MGRAGPGLRESGLREWAEVDVLPPLNPNPVDDQQYMVQIQTTHPLVVALVWTWVRRTSGARQQQDGLRTLV